MTYGSATCGKFGALEAKLKASLAAFAGASAKASGRLEVGKAGVGATGEASAFAGVKSKQGVTVEVSFKDFGAEVGAEAEELAGASGSAAGSFSFTKNEIAVSGEFSAFAGVQATGTVHASGKLYGREALKLDLKGIAKAGVGAKGHGGFRIRRGKVELHFEADVTVGVGGGAGTSLAVDSKPIAVYIWRQAYKAWWAANKGEADKVLAAPQSVKPDLMAELEQYAQAKIAAIKADKADNFVKEEKIQAIIGTHVPYAQVKKHKNASNVDAMIKSAVEAALENTTGKKGIVAKVQDGKVRKINGLPDPKEIKAEAQVVSEKTAAPLSSVLAYK